jgi:hypothetical protein
LDLNGDPSVCATFYTAGGVGELYQRRSVITMLSRSLNHQDLGRAETAGSRYIKND